MEKQKWCHDDDLDSDSNISTRLQKTEDDDKISSCLSQLLSTDRFNINSSQKRSNPEKERHAELFRKDLISAMKLADSELLQPEEYFQISDPWKLEWERGVQVPINPGAILPVAVKVIPENENFYGLSTFKMPKKFLHASQDDAYKPAVHELHEIHKVTEQVCRYDLDDLDTTWLQIFNELRDETGEDPVTEIDMERVMEELESRCFVKLQQAQKTVEGLGIEYDENVVCDVCRSPEGEDSNEMVFCDSCDICVHQACYGIQTIPEGNWLCRTCALGIKPQCVLCPNSGGALKSTKSGNEWAHISCALWIPEVSIGCPEKMEPITNISQIPASRWALVCTLCRERNGACIQCCIKSCKISFHVTCAFQHNLELKTMLDEKMEDVQLKAYCPKHSGQNHEDSMNEDGIPVTPARPPIKPELTEEEKTELRSHRLKKLEEEFYNYVNAKEVSEAVGIDETTVEYFYGYWVIKRKSQFNHPLLMPKLEEGDILLKQREDGLIARMKMFIHLRQDLERVRNLCYMVNKREKFRRQLYRMKEEIFHQQAKVLAEENFQVDDDSVLTAHRLTGTIYDHPEGILGAAELMVRLAQSADMVELSSSISVEKISTKFENSCEKPVKFPLTDGEMSPIQHVDMSFEIKKDTSCVSTKRGKHEGASDGHSLLGDNFSFDSSSRLNDIDELTLKNPTNYQTDDSIIELNLNNINFVELNDMKTDMYKLPEDEELYPHKTNSLDHMDMVPKGSKQADFKSGCLLDSKIYDIIDDECEPPAVFMGSSVKKGKRNSHITDSSADLCHPNTDLVCQLNEKIKPENYQPGAETGEDMGTEVSAKKANGEQRSKHSQTSVKNSPSVDDMKELPVVTSLSSIGKSKMARIKRNRTGFREKQSKRLRLNNENVDVSHPEKKESISALTPDSSSSLNGAQTEYVERQPDYQQNANLLKKEVQVKPDSLSTVDSASDGVGCRSETDRWSSLVSQKLSPKDEDSRHRAVILNRFSLDQLVVSEEIKQRVANRLMNLSQLSSFNGLCKHLQQKLADCKLRFSGTLGQRKNKDHEDDFRYSSGKGNLSDGKNNASASIAWNVYSNTNNLNRPVLDKNTVKEKWKNEVDNTISGNYSRLLKQRRRLGKRISVLNHECEYELDGSDSSKTLNSDEFGPSDSPNSGCRVFSIEGSSCEEQDLDEGSSDGTFKRTNWVSKFKR